MVSCCVDERTPGGRDRHLLPNGEVFVAGGYNGFDEMSRLSSSRSNLDLAELFNVSTDTWTKAPPMLVPRSFQTATLLPNGQVLVIGGWETPNNTGAGVTDETYDPASNTWTPVAPPTELQTVESATSLPNGWVFITGLFGRETFPAAAPGAALYDPPSNTWERTAAPKHARETAKAVLLANGSVLTVGGSRTAEEYDPSTNEWTELAPMKYVRSQETATLMPEGNVLVTGGAESTDKDGYTDPALNSTEMYDPTTNSWTALAPMITARELHSATLLPDGDVLVAGGGDCGDGEGGGCLGYGGSGDCCGASSAELYDPSTNTWSFTTPVLSGDEHTATLMPNGDVLITGGNLDPVDTSELSNVAVYAPSYPPDEPQTPTSPNPPTAMPAAIPMIADAVQSHKVWREGNAVAYLSADRPKPPIGTTFSFTLNEQANVTLAFTQRVDGRIAKGKCIPQTSRSRHAPGCKRAVTVGTLSLAGHGATNKVSFQGRISRSKKLKPGRYTLLITATNSAGVHSASTSLSFTIVK